MVIPSCKVIDSILIEGRKMKTDNVIEYDSEWYDHQQHLDHKDKSFVFSNKMTESRMVIDTILANGHTHGPDASEHKNHADHGDWEEWIDTSS